MSRPESPCELLAWDSQFFGFRIGRVRGNRIDEKQLESVLAWCEREQIECLYFLSDAGHAATIRLVEEQAFHFVDIRMTYMCDLQKAEQVSITNPASSPLNIRIACPTDLPELKSIARDSYQDTRFYFDSCFPRPACAALYETWVEKSLHGGAEAVLVAEQMGQIAGYTTCVHLRPEDLGQIGLVGVHPAAREQGVGRTLVAHALTWFKERGFRHVKVVTQGRNLLAQRLYQSSHFFIDSVQLWYHKWFIHCKNE